MAGKWCTAGNIGHLHTKTLPLFTTAIFIVQQPKASLEITSRKRESERVIMLIAQRIASMIILHSRNFVYNIQHSNIFIIVENFVSLYYLVLTKGSRCMKCFKVWKFFLKKLVFLGTVCIEWQFHCWHKIFDTLLNFVL